jgi:hypothetical protein
MPGSARWEASFNRWLADPLHAAWPDNPEPGTFTASAWEQLTDEFARWAETPPDPTFPPANLADLTERYERYLRNGVFPPKTPPPPPPPGLIDTIWAWIQMVRRWNSPVIVNP